MLFDSLMMTADRISPWQTYTGSLDGAATAVLSSVYVTYGGTNYYTSFAACMVSDTKGIATGFFNGSGSDGGRQGPMQAALFTVSGTSATLNNQYNIGGEYYGHSSMRASLVRLDDTRCLMLMTYQGVGGYGVKARVITIDPVGNTLSFGTEIAVNPGAGVYAGQAFLQAPDKVFMVSDAQAYPVLFSVSGTTVTASYPLGYISDWGIRGGAWRIDDTHFWCVPWFNNGGTAKTQIYSLSGTAATLVGETVPPGNIDTSGRPISGNQLLRKRWNGTNYNYFFSTIDPVTYAYSDGPNLAYTDSGAYAMDALCGPIDGVQLWYGNAGGAMRVCCASFSDGNVAVSSPVAIYTGTVASPGLRAFPNTPTKALAFYQVSTTGYVKVLQAA